MLDSEVATYKALHAPGLPVAEVHAWGVQDLSLTLGDTFFQSTVQALKKVDLRSNYVYCTPGHDAFHLDRSTGLAPLDAETSRLIRCFAEHAIMLSQAPFEGIGSPRSDGQDVGRRAVGPFIPPIAFVRPEPPHFGGPFSTMRDYYLWQIEIILDVIKRGFCFRDAPLFFFLVHPDIRRMVMNEQGLTKEENEFYITHPDPAGRNLLVEKGNITAYVDWQRYVSMAKGGWTARLTLSRSSTSCLEAAFGAPPWMTDPVMLDDHTDPLSPLEIKLQDDYRSLGRPDLADSVIKARVHQRLDRVIGYRVCDINSSEHWAPYMLRLYCLMQMMNGTSEDELARCPAELQEMLCQRYGLDEDFEAVARLDQELKRRREPRVSGLNAAFRDSVGHDKT